jgi:syntaxin 8
MIIFIGLPLLCELVTWLISGSNPKPKIMKGPHIFSNQSKGPHAGFIAPRNQGLIRHHRKANVSQKSPNSVSLLLPTDQEKPPFHTKATTMASINPSQLFLLADHIKLSLLERQRATQLNLPANTQDAQISRSLDQLADSITALERQTEAASGPEQDQVSQLRSQYIDLKRQFRGQDGGEDTLVSPNDEALRPDFEAAQRREKGKAVRFSDDPEAAAASSTSVSAANAKRAQLFPYKDNPDEEEEDSAPDHALLSNQQIHEYHKNVMTEQDEQLDNLGHSIGRQRELTIAIGNELDEQIVLLDEVDERTDRHQGRLDGANRSLKTFMEKAKQNWSLTTIAVLIIILVLLIAITK